MSDVATKEVVREIPIARDVVTREAGKGSGRVSSTRAPSSIEAYREDFERQESGPAWLDDLRAKAITRFETLGYPTTKNEDWHFTSVAPIAEHTFRLSTLHSAGALGVKAADLERFGFGQAEWHRLVFINGVFDESLSSFEDGGGAVRVDSLADAIKSGEPAVQQHLGTVAKFEQHTFTALNTAFISDGAFIELARDAVVDQPIHLVFISGGEGVSHPRNLIVAGRHSRAAIIESYVSLRDSEYFTNPVTEIVVGEGAHIDHYKLQRESESAFHVAALVFIHSRRRAGAHQRLHVARWRCRDVHAERPLPHRRNAAHRQPDEHRAHRSQLSEPRGVQGSARRAITRRVQRESLRASRGAEDRREAEQQQSPALAHRARGHQAPTRDIRR
ncbi:MAG: hypothetical protein DMD63_04060 [Gemmatimonadetes bacterium]|nr:MAG: hypothetical protein DMD63_04060 [Gemmatimonadota bacterium]